MEHKKNNTGTEFTWPVRVYYEDTDAGGVVFYANYLRFMERARTEYLRALGFEQDVLKHRSGVIFAVHSVSIRYRKPAVFNDALTVITTITGSGKASLNFKQMITRDTDRAAICDADVRIACLDAQRFSPRPIPAEILEAVHGN